MTAYKLPQIGLEAGPIVSMTPRVDNPVAIFVDGGGAVDVMLSPCEGNLAGMPGAGLTVALLRKTQSDMLALNPYRGENPAYGISGG